MMNSENKTISRRQILKGLSTAGAVSLAGCNGIGGSDRNSSQGGQQGERVPALTLEYWTGLGGPTNDFENSIPIIQDSWKQLGVKTNPKGIDYATNVSQIASGKIKARHASFWYHYPSPDRLDPNNLLVRWGVQRAGDTRTDNPGDYTNCKFTTLSQKQSVNPNKKKRRDQVFKAEKIRSGDYFAAPMVPRPSVGAVRNSINAKSIGEAGISLINPRFFIKSAPKNNTLSASCDSSLVSTKNYLTIPNIVSQVPWNQLVSSTLIGYNANYESENLLAKNINVSDDGHTVTIELRNATFHNGDPITSEDVIFTLKLLRNNVGSIPKATEPPYNKFKIIGNKTLKIKLKKPYPPLMTRTFPLFGILHKKSWEQSGALENLSENFPNKIIGSGPFKLSNFSSGQQMKLVPHDGHPVFSPNHNIRFTAYSSSQATIRAFKQSKIDVMTSVSPGRISQIENMGDKAKVVSKKTFLPYIIYWEHPRPPFKFKEFRQAAGMAINRQKIASVAFFGATEPSTSAELMQESHPWRAPEDMITKYTDKPSGDIQGAKQVLENNGWSFDNQGNLRYPTDADLSLKWPNGKTPDPKNFPCLNQQGEYVSPENR